jgi:release factor glutamine methyltransferase
MMTDTEKRQLLREKYNGKTCDEYLADCERVEEGEPLAYVIGHVPFLTTRIFLDSRPLIPRSETEEWTRDARDMLRRRKGGTLSLLDLFSGSGAVGVSLAAALPHSHVTFSDIRKDHLALAQKNARENGISLGRVSCIESDVFSRIPNKPLYDAILANPPYIPNDRSLPESVKGYEPHDALFGGPDGLTYIVETLRGAHSRLKKPYGVLFLEHDSTQLETLKRLVVHFPYEVLWKRDIEGRPRYLIARPL